MTQVESRYDDVVVGAGPCGAAIAIGAARRGRRVLLLEASPEACHRFAGEWIHPSGLRALAAIGADVEARLARPTEGFVVLPDDASDPILLPYADGAHGLAAEHHVFVETLRAAATSEDGVSYLGGARALEITERSVVVRTSDGREQRVFASRIVGADGRGSVVRKALGHEPPSSPMSRMAGIELTDVELPFEGYGHVVLGGPGPMLLYRIDARRARVCLDVPAGTLEGKSDADTLYREFRAAMPLGLRGAFQQALRERPIAWAANVFRPRTFYGRRRVLLAGDAVGCFHPLTASGISVGLNDAAVLLDYEDAGEYGRRRESESYVPELLANALYQVFVRRDPSAAAIRGAVYAIWRDEPAERRRTMRILAGDEVRLAQFGGAFLRVATDAGRRMLASRAEDGDLRDTMAHVRDLARWARWPAATAVPRIFRARRRPKSTPGNPFGDAKAERRAREAIPAATATSDETKRCWDHLAEVSRTFVRPIDMLPEPLRTAVMCGYLLCRIADTVEDHPALDVDARDAGYAALLDVLERSASPRGFERLWDGLGDARDVVLCRELGVVLRVFEGVPAGMRRKAIRWVAEMTRGMQLYSHRPRGEDGLYALTTREDLQRYCYFVAGTVGHMLTDLFLEELDLREDDGLALRMRAEAFGVGLQLTNILKDVTDDRERGWSFVPRTTCASASIDLRDLLDPGRRERAHEAVRPIFAVARACLDEALDYALAVPAEQARIRLFCLLPLFMAARTLTFAEGNDAIFVPGEAVKIPRDEVEQLIAECVAHASDDAALRARYAELWRPRADRPAMTTEARG